MASIYYSTKVNKKSMVDWSLMCQSQMVGVLFSISYTNSKRELVRDNFISYLHSKIQFCEASYNKYTSIYIINV